MTLELPVEFHPAGLSTVFVFLGYRSAIDERCDGAIPLIDIPAGQVLGRKD